MNRLTLIIDGNWLMRSRMYVLEKHFKVGLKDHQKIAAQNELVELLARSVSNMLRKFPEIDNAILVSDGGSWRNRIPIPRQLQGETYKGNRTAASELDWDLIYKAFNIFVQNASSIGLTTSCHSGVEGDDWVWYWSRRLNTEGVNTIIWSSDCDLKQLVQVSNGIFTAWYNDKVGLVLPEELELPDDPMEFFLNPSLQCRNQLAETIQNRAGKSEYINPASVVINKILCGDSGDNIMAVVRFEKNHRIYRFSQTDYKSICEDLNLSEIHDTENKFDSIASWIVCNKKFKPYSYKTSDIVEMLKYNLKLVWLNESQIPNSIITAMNQFEYKEFDVSQLRKNFKILITRSDGAEDIFDQLFN